jgi:hypothetical protein
MARLSRSWAEPLVHLRDITSSRVNFSLPTKLRHRYGVDGPRSYQPGRQVEDGEIRALLPARDAGPRYSQSQIFRSWSPAGYDDLAIGPSSCM